MTPGYLNKMRMHYEAAITRQPLTPNRSASRVVFPYLSVFPKYNRRASRVTSTYLISFFTNLNRSASRVIFFEISRRDFRRFFGHFFRTLNTLQIIDFGGNFGRFFRPNFGPNFPPSALYKLLDRSLKITQNCSKLAFIISLRSICNRSRPVGQSGRTKTAF